MEGRFDRVRGKLPTLFVGATAGLIAIWLISRRLLRTAPDEAVDLDALRRSLAGLPGAGGVHLRDLGGGIVEAVGAAPDADAVEGVLSALRAAPGVLVVVNRIWTRTSAGERTADLSRVRLPSDPAED